jgi:hypothetical protein
MVCHITKYLFWFDYNNIIYVYYERQVLSIKLNCNKCLLFQVLWFNYIDGVEHDGACTYKL